MKKIALCLYGNFNNRLSPQSGIDGARYIKEHIIAHSNVDIFIHSWDLNNESLIRQEYGPWIKSVQFEPQIDFSQLVNELGIDRDLFLPPGGEKFRTIENSFSFFYSRSESIKLKKCYEEQTHLTYDCVVVCRFDLGQMDKYNGFQDYRVSEISFDTHLDMNFIYTAYWNQLNSGYTDMWFYSSSKNIDRLGEMFEYSKKYFLPNSSYIEALTNGWPDSHQDDEFSNEFYKKVKSDRLVKYDPKFAHNNHLMHKWFFIDSGLYLKTKFLPKYSNTLCHLIFELNPSTEQLQSKLENLENFSRVAAPMVFFSKQTPSQKNHDSRYKIIHIDSSVDVKLQLIHFLENILHDGFKIIYLDSVETLFCQIMDYKYFKLACQYVYKDQRQNWLTDGYDVLFLNPQNHFFSLRRPQNKHLLFSHPFTDYSYVGSIWKIESLIGFLKNKAQLDLHENINFYQLIKLRHGVFQYKNKHQVNDVFPRRLTSHQK